MSVNSSEYFRLCGSRYKRLKPLIDNLHIQRDKRFAHNDKDLMFDYDMLSVDSPVSLVDMERLVSFALDFVINTISVLSGEQRAHEFFNIDDLRNTFQLVRYGKEYKKLKSKQ